jgi:hypothetical protein
VARAVLGQVDGALVALAGQTASLQADPDGRVGVHEVTPGSSASFVRLDRFVQIVDLDGRVVRRSTSAQRLPVSSRCSGRCARKKIIPDPPRLR